MNEKHSILALSTMFAAMSPDEWRREQLNFPVEKSLYTIQAGTLIIKDINDYYLIIKILKEHRHNDNIVQVLLYLQDNGCYEGAMELMFYLKEYPKKVVTMNNCVGTMGGRYSQLSVQQLAEAYKDLATSFDDFRKVAKPFPLPKSKYHK